MDLSKADTVRAALDVFAHQLLAVDNESASAISESFRVTQKFDYNADLKITDGEAYIDLADFAMRIAARFPGSPLGVAAQNLVNVLLNDANPFIIRERHGSGKIPSTKQQIYLDNANGVSLYLPIGEKDSFRAEYSDVNLQLAADTVWDEYVFKAVNLYNPQALGRGDGRGSNPDPLSIRGTVYLPIVRR